MRIRISSLGRPGLGAEGHLRADAHLKRGPVVPKAEEESVSLRPDLETPVLGQFRPDNAMVKCEQLLILRTESL